MLHLLALTRGETFVDEIRDEVKPALSDHAGAPLRGCEEVAHLNPSDIAKVALCLSVAHTILATRIRQASGVVLSFERATFCTRRSMRPWAKVRQAQRDNKGRQKRTWVGKIVIGTRMKAKDAKNVKYWELMSKREPLKEGFCLVVSCAHEVSYEGIEVCRGTYQRAQTFHWECRSQERPCVLRSD